MPGKFITAVEVSGGYRFPCKVVQDTMDKTRYWQSNTRVIESLPSDSSVDRPEAELFPVGGSMSPVEEMKLIEQRAQAIPDEQDPPTGKLRRFSEVKEFDVEEWLSTAD
ncbi:MAG: hypothetical protein ACJ8G3_06840 [Burkholderiaceae bacterium]